MATTTRNTTVRTSDDPTVDGGVAAVDLGSNSFHLVVAREQHGQLHVLDRDRNQVMLASGLSGGQLDEAVEKRALHCLERFGERLADMSSDAVRAVGTSTLRRIRDDGAFLKRAEEALGHPIEVVSGMEEARLVYLGVAHHASPMKGDRRLVVDIGGGSTECIVGEGFEAVEGASLDVGCVRSSLRYFKGGKITDKRFERAIIGAQLELRAIKRRFRAHGWSSCLGSSGTIRAVATILGERFGDPEITLERLVVLRGLMVTAGSTKALSLPGMSDERAPVLPGGVAILLGLFRSLRIESMVAATGALREGVLYDLLGRIHHEDVRDRTIRMFSQRYHVDEDQARRVERTARVCFDAVCERWGLNRDVDRMRLSWAARLHEIGRSVSYSGYHRHGAYLVEHADMPGFSMEDQRVLAALVRAHRRKIPSDLTEHIPRGRSRLRRLLALLRVAVLIHRSRGERVPPIESIDTDAKDSLRILFPDGWLSRHVMTHADLKAERATLRGLRITLIYR